MSVCTRSMGGVNIAISGFHHPGYGPNLYSSRVSSATPDDHFLRQRAVFDHSTLGIAECYSKVLK